MNRSTYSERLAFHHIEIDKPILIEFYDFYYVKPLNQWCCLMNIVFKQKVIFDINEVRV